MLGPVATMNAAIANAIAAIAVTPLTRLISAAHTAAPSVPICRAVSRPIFVSARCPHTGLNRMRATAIAAITRPISLPERPRPSR